MRNAFGISTLCAAESLAERSVRETFRDRRFIVDNYVECVIGVRIPFAYYAVLKYGAGRTNTLAMKFLGIYDCVPSPLTLLPTAMHIGAFAGV